MSNYIPLTPAQIPASKHIEQQRDAALLGVPCPVCDAAVGIWCRSGGDAWGSQHTGRYLLAAAKGLVPLLPGMRHG